jgi:AAA+ superfamily predicted ATPase
VNITTDVVEDSGTQKIFEWNSDKKTVYANIITGSFKFTYEGTEFIVQKVTWADIKCREHYFYDLITETSDDSAGRKLADDVFTWSNDLKKEIWVLQNGYWHKSKSLYQSIQQTKWDDIILDETFKSNLRRDTATFFSSQEIYRSLGISWKRGILFLGPPGNGKTESIKALLNETSHSILYAKTIATPWGPEYGVRMVFEKARKHSPCILVLEDLDSMVTDKVKSFFLNELDGLALNDGILTIASTNHPEDIDDAIINRPSRFDTKYTYSLPTVELRNAFAIKWLNKITKLSEQTGVTFEKSDEELAQGIAEKTEGWSFAFLKELFISFLLRTAHDKSISNTPNKPVESADIILFKQLEDLSSQILKLTNEEEERRKKKKEAAGSSEWCPPPTDDSTFVHAGENF